VIANFFGRSRQTIWTKLLALSMLLLTLMMFCASTVAMAAVSDQPVSNGEQTTGFTDSNFQAQMEKSMDEANFFERAVMKLINSLFKLAGIAPIPDLIFGNPYKYWGITNGGNLNYNLFYDREMNGIINPLIMAFTSGFVTFATLAIMLSSLKLGVTAHSPQARADFWKDIQMWILSALFMGSFWFFFQAICEMNAAISGTIAQTMVANGLNSNSVSIIAAAGTNQDFFGLGDIIIFLGEWILTVILNFIYISRKIVIIFLVILSPFAAYALMFARTRQFFGTWVKELLGNIFLPCIHGIIIYTFASLSALGAGTFFKLGMLIMFIPASGIVSRWLQLGDSGSKLGSALTMAGMSGVAGAMVLGRGAFQMAGGLRKMGGGSAGGEPGSANFTASGSDYGSTAISNAAAKSRTGFGKVLNMAKNTGAVVGGTVGALAGMVAGPGGAVVGGVVGSKVGGGLVSAGSNMVSGGVNASRAIGGIVSLARSGDWNRNLAQRRHLMGNLGESLGSMVGGQAGGTVGRAAGNALSLATRRRIQTEQFGGMTAQEYAAKYPEAEIYWKADSMKSGFYMKRNGQETLISALGGGMADLKNPVYVPFKTPPAGASVTRGINGTYSMARSYPATSSGSSQSIPTPGSIMGSAGSNQSAPMPGQSITTPTVGLQGSTESFLRIGEAYTMDSNGQKYHYSGLNASSINVDSYFIHSAPGLKTGSAAGRVVDKVIGTTSVEELRKREAYTQKLTQIANEFQKSNASRVKGVV
jgi:hypothetical protein